MLPKPPLECNAFHVEAGQLRFTTAGLNVTLTSYGDKRSHVFCLYGPPSEPCVVTDSHSELRPRNPNNLSMSIRFANGINV